MELSLTSGMPVPLGSTAGTRSFTGGAGCDGTTADEVDEVVVGGGGGVVVVADAAADGSPSAALVEFFFLTSCSALLISSSVTPWVERRVSRTRLACAFRCVSLSSSRVGGTKDLKKFLKILPGESLFVEAGTWLDAVVCCVVGGEEGLIAAA